MKRFIGSRAFSARGVRETKSIIFTYGFAVIIAVSMLFSSCNDEGTDEPEDNTNPTESQLIFKCKIGGEQFTATYVTTTSTSGIISAKGLTATNGANPLDGTIRMTVSFGTNPSGELGTGAHEIVGSFFETANNPDNKNKGIFKDVVINGKNAYVDEGGTVNVEKYYESTYWQGAKGTFTNIKFYTYTPDIDSVMVTDGEFDVKYVIPGL